MFQGTQSIWISQNRKTVYEVAQSYPTFVRFFSSKSRIIDQNASRTYVEVHTNLLGIYPSVWQGEGIKKPYDEIDFTQTQGLFQGLKAIWSFRDKDGGTEVSILTTFSKPKLGPFLEQILGKYLVEATTRKILSELRFQSEKKTDA